MQAANSIKRIGILGFEGVAALDLTGVLEAFHIADGRQPGGPLRRYETLVVGLTSAAFTAESGVRLLPDVTIDQVPALDTIVVPGGPGLRGAEINAVVAGWLRARSGEARRLVSVCTGLYGLAASGLMDGRIATTHWLHAADAARRFPSITLQPDAIFIRDGRFYSSAGMTAGIDLALALIEEDHGPAVALATARQLVVYMKRSGGQLQYSEPLRAQTLADRRFETLIDLMIGQLGADWSVEAMAARTRLSSRQFSRRFKAVFGATPAAHLEALRLDEARIRLASSGQGLAGIAHAVGFSSDDVFRRSFERKFGVTPAAYRSRFRTINSAPAPGSHQDDDDEASPYS